MAVLPFPFPDWQSFFGPKSQNGQPSPLPASLSGMVILFCPKWKSQNGMGIMFSTSLKGRVDRPFPKRAPQRNGRSTKSKTWWKPKHLTAIHSGISGEKGRPFGDVPSQVRSAPSSIKHTYSEKLLNARARGTRRTHKKGISKAGFRVYDIGFEKQGGI